MAHEKNGKWLKRHSMYAREKKPKISAKVSIDRLAQLLKLPTSDDMNFEDYTGDVYSDAYNYKHKEAFDEGMSDDDAEAVAIKYAEEVEAAEVNDAYRKYRHAVEHAAEKLFDQHALELVPVKPKQKDAEPWEFTVEPVKSWEDAAAKLIDTINGVGYFEFASVKDFLESGPYTARQAVLQHLHWIKDRPAVYGDSSARSIFDRDMRY